jgi:NSS family neurotransmitter:Na+ symporter
VLLIGLAIYSCNLPGAGKGLRWYLVPDFSAVDFMDIFQAAVVQVFFSVGIGMAIAFVYGSYVAKDSNLCTDSVIAVAMDTSVAFLAGMVIMPALFAYGIAPSSGPGLIFISLPQLFNSMGPVAGRIFGCLFLFAVFLACITSMVAVLEGAVVNLGERFNIPRKTANLIVVLVTYGVSVIVTLNQGVGVLSAFKIFGMDIFSFFDMIGTAFGLTFSAVSELAFVVFVMGFAKFQQEVNMGAGKIRVGNWMKGYYNVVLPVILIFVVICVFRMYFGG